MKSGIHQIIEDLNKLVFLVYARKYTKFYEKLYHCINHHFFRHNSNLFRTKDKSILVAYYQLPSNLLHNRNAT